MRNFVRRFYFTITELGVEMISISAIGIDLLLTTISLASIT